MKKGFLVFFVLLLVALFAVSCATPPPTQAPTGTQASPGASPGASPVKSPQKKTLKGVTGVVVFEVPLPKGKLIGSKIDPKTKKGIKLFLYKDLVASFEVPGMGTGYPFIVGEDGSFEMLNIDVTASISEPAQITKYNKITISMPKFKEVVLTNVPNDPMKPSDLGKIVLKHI